ncbi:hypothetical protein AKJ16_DCAP26065 [Drosera capensis]
MTCNWVTHVLFRRKILGLGASSGSGRILVDMKSSETVEAACWLPSLEMVSKWVLLLGSFERWVSFKTTPSFHVPSGIQVSRCHLAHFLECL